jgi:hypothetical protein
MEKVNSDRNLHYRSLKHVTIVNPTSGKHLDDEVWKAMKIQKRDREEIRDDFLSQLVGHRLCPYSGRCNRRFIHSMIQIPKQSPRLYPFVVPTPPRLTTGRLVRCPSAVSRPAVRTNLRRSQFSLCWKSKSLPLHLPLFPLDFLWLPFWVAHLPVEFARLPKRRLTNTVVRWFRSEQTMEQWPSVMRS